MESDSSHRRRGARVLLCGPMGRIRIHSPSYPYGDRRGGGPRGPGGGGRGPPLQGKKVRPQGDAQAAVGGAADIVITEKAAVLHGAECFCLIQGTGCRLFYVAAFHVGIAVAVAVVGAHGMAVDALESDLYGQAFGGIAEGFGLVGHDEGEVGSSQPPGAQLFPFRAVLFDVVPFHDWVACRISA